MIHNNNKKALKKFCQALRDLISVHLYNFMFYPLFCIHTALLAIPKLFEAFCYLRLLSLLFFFLGSFSPDICMTLLFLSLILNYHLS